MPFPLAEPACCGEEGKNARSAFEPQALWSAVPPRRFVLPRRGGYSHNSHNSHFFPCPPTAGTAAISPSQRDLGVCDIRESVVDCF